MRPLGFLAVIGMLLGLVGCFRVDQLPAAVDGWAFFKMGGTFFVNPDALTLKEIHLDTGSLTGREVIVEGQVADVSSHGTYLVLKDETARMLVVLTEMEDAGPLLKSLQPKALRVMGTVETGKKGLPFVRARAVNQPGDASVGPAAKT